MNNFHRAIELLGGVYTRRHHRTCQKFRKFQGMKYCRIDGIPWDSFEHTQQRVEGNDGSLIKRSLASDKIEKTENEIIRPSPYGATVASGRFCNFRKWGQVWMGLGRRIMITADIVNCYDNSPLSGLLTRQAWLSFLIVSVHKALHEWLDWLNSLLFFLWYFLVRCYARKKKRLWRDPSIDWLWNSSWVWRTRNFLFSYLENKPSTFKNSWLPQNYSLRPSWKHETFMSGLPSAISGSTFLHADTQERVWWKIDLLIFVFIEFLR